MATAAPQRRIASPRPADGPSGEGSNRLFLVWIALALIVGVVIGAAFMRARRARMDQAPIVTVNGANITKDEFLRRLELSVGANLIRAMVNEEIYLQYAKKEKLAPTDAQVNEEFERLSSQPGFKERMKVARLTTKDVKRNLRVGLSRNAVITKGVTVSEADARSFYERDADPRNPNARWHRPAEAAIAWIVTSSEADARKARSALDGNEPWDAVVKKYSIERPARVYRRGQYRPGDPVRVVKGRTNARTVPGLETFVFGMKKGTLSDPKRIRGNWFVISCIDQQPEWSLPYDKAKDACVEGAKLLKVQKAVAGDPTKLDAMDSKLKEFITKSNVVTFDKRYDKLVKAHLKGTS